LTTIAFRDGVLASDSKISSGSDVFVGEFKKVFKLVVEEQLSWVERLVFRKEPHQIEYLIGAAGTLSDIQEYIGCMFLGEERTKGDYDCSLLAIQQDEDGGYIIRKYDGGLRGHVVNAKYASIGSGYEIALGAMYQGASAEEAVAAAMYHDNTSGGELQKVSFADDEE
jgi:ATP-dependent protease HslVU (ClpYQ) peptidase subunit